jgi:hypothetical protein
MKQADNTSCGVFVSLWPYLVTTGHEIKLDNKSIDMFRTVICEEIWNFKENDGQTTNLEGVFPKRGSPFWKVQNTQCPKVAISRTFETTKYLNTLPVNI